MGIRSSIKKYKDYESKELARRAAKKGKLIPYKTLASKRMPVKKSRSLKLTARNITRAIDNPYGVKFPKAKKVMKKVKKKKLKQRVKTVVVYR